MIKLDKLGNKEWQKTYGDALIDFGHSTSLVQTIDGGFVMGGSGSHLNDDNWEYYVQLVKTDSFGNEKWNTTYARSENIRVS